MFQIIHFQLTSYPNRKKKNYTNFLTAIKKFEAHFSSILQCYKNSKNFGISNIGLQTLFTNHTKKLC